MKTTRFTLTVLLILSFAGVLANAQPFTYTFEPEAGNSGDWSRFQNWTGGAPNGIPVSGDTAIIPGGKTCIVQSADQAAQKITVAGTATLQIAGRNLTLGGTIGTSIIDGLVELVASGPQAPTLSVSTPLNFGGAFGTIRGEPGSGAEIRRLSGPAGNEGFSLGPLTKITGAIKITATIVNGGRIQAQTATDDIEIGLDSPSGSDVVVAGNGIVECVAGKITFKTVKLSSANNWEVSGGELRVTSDAATENRTGDVQVTLSGTLNIESNYLTSGDLIFSGGMIKVADGKSSQFNVSTGG